MSAEEWRDTAEAPLDGTPIVGSEFYRYQPYAPHPNRTVEPRGRWQRWCCKGWINNPEGPVGWQPMGPDLPSPWDSEGNPR